MLGRQEQEESCPRFLWITAWESFGQGGIFLVFGPLHGVAQFLGRFLSYCFPKKFFQETVKTLNSLRKCNAAVNLYNEVDNSM